MQKTAKRELAAACIITVLMAFMDISGLPSALFPGIHILDIEPAYFTLMLNFILALALCFALRKLLCPNWALGLGPHGTSNGLKQYGLAGLLALAASLLAFCIGLRGSFDQSPSVWKVLIEGFAYYLGVAVIEEIYIRGFLLNILEKLFWKSQNAVLKAVSLSSLIFGLGHMPGMIGFSPFVAASNVAWTIGLGLYFGMAYKKTGSLWVPVILHAAINLAGIPFVFSSTNAYPAFSIAIILPACLMLGAYSVLVMMKPKQA
jgi:membrane protease YdiL (CAAX protease family)